MQPTSTQRLLRSGRILQAEYDAETEWIEVVEPYKVALQRDSNPDRKRPVGKKVLRNFYMKYYPHLIAPMTDNRPDD